MQFSMENFFRVITTLGSVGVWVLFWVLKKIGASSDEFFKEKAKNLATTQDIAKITEQTERVKNYFEQQSSIQNREINYKYNLLEAQHNSLYVELYGIICNSEALRKIKIKEEPDLTFSNYPIIDIDDGEEKAIDKMIDLIINNKKYSSLKLIWLASLYRTLQQREQSYLPKDESISEQISEVAHKLVITILDDYKEIRHSLKLDSDYCLPEMENTVFEMILRK